MIKVNFYLRNVVAIAICLAGMTMFSGCDSDSNDDASNGDGNTNTGTAKLLSKMTLVAGDENIPLETHTTVIEFLYNAEKELIGYTALSGVRNYTCNISRSGNKVLISENAGNSVELTLNSEGNAVSIVEKSSSDDYGSSYNYLTTTTITYDANKQIKTTSSESHRTENSEIIPIGQSSYEHTWASGNLVLRKSDYVTSTIEYTTYPNNCPFDFNWMQVIGSDMFACMLDCYGVRPKNLASKETRIYLDDNSSSTTTYTYKFDKDGNVIESKSVWLSSGGSVEIYTFSFEYK